MLFAFTGFAVYAATVWVESTGYIAAVGGVSVCLGALCCWGAVRQRRVALSQAGRIGILEDGQDAISRAVEDYLITRRVYHLGGLVPLRRRLDWLDFRHWMETRGLECPRTVVDRDIVPNLLGGIELVEYLLEPEGLGAVDMTSIPLIASMGVFDDQRGRRWLAGDATMFVQGDGNDFPTMVLIGPAGRLKLPAMCGTPKRLAALWQRWNHPRPRPELAV